MEKYEVRELIREEMEHYKAVKFCPVCQMETTMLRTFGWSSEATEEGLLCLCCLTHLEEKVVTRLRLKEEK